MPPANPVFMRRGRSGHARRGRDLGQARAFDELTLGGLEDLAEQRPGDPQQVGDLRVREPVVDLVSASLADDEQVPFQHGEVLREVRRLETGRVEQFRDGCLGRGRQHLEHPHPQRMRQPLEEVGLDLVERPVGVGLHGSGHPFIMMD